jgi:protein-L-isoaspartate(D-aspartate) O-methyltransferase
VRQSAMQCPKGDYVTEVFPDGSDMAPQAKRVASFLEGASTIPGSRYEEVSFWPASSYLRAAVGVPIVVFRRYALGKKGLMGIPLPDLTRARNRMVDVQIARRGVLDPLVLAAMRLVPREAFVSPELADFAYDDGPLPIGEGQTISQPYVVALMIEAAELKPGERVLEVGAGSGYAAAVLSRIAGEIYAIERQPSLARDAADRLNKLGYRNVILRVADGAEGWAEAAPFDAILVAAGSLTIPEALKAQLAIGGRMIIPVGETDGQNLLKIVRRGEMHFDEEYLGPVRFVPLIAGQGG